MPKRMIHETVRVKPKMQWRSQEVGDVRNVDHLLRKAVSSEWSQSKTEAMWATASKATGTGLSKPSGTHIIPLYD
jgi:hypothetical protein